MTVEEFGIADRQNSVGINQTAGDFSERWQVDWVGARNDQRVVTHVQRPVESDLLKVGQLQCLDARKANAGPLKSVHHSHRRIAKCRIARQVSRFGFLCVAQHSKPVGSVRTGSEFDTARHGKESTRGVVQYNGFIDIVAAKDHDRLSLIRLLRK
ncbi:hypothetical protein Pla52n_68870 [Stieleria varia]|uniref:Uncharacterized protein n=1 Tax=Stieleria varia TaxID=2528005 RepID=A0A5C5ZSQ9_9BACT|nr:hypothetical protein Pla52n_68870 [Stieleria varia]